MPKPEMKRLWQMPGEVSSGSQYRGRLPNEQNHLGNLPWRNLELLPGASSRTCEDWDLPGRSLGCISPKDKKHTGNLPGKILGPWL